MTKEGTDDVKVHEDEWQHAARTARTASWVNKIAIPFVWRRVMARVRGDEGREEYIRSVGMSSRVRFIF